MWIPLRCACCFWVDDSHAPQANAMVQATVSPATQRGASMQTSPDVSGHKVQSTQVTPPAEPAPPRLRYEAEAVVTVPADESPISPIPRPPMTTSTGINPITPEPSATVADQNTSPHTQHMATDAGTDAWQHPVVDGGNNPRSPVATASTLALAFGTINHFVLLLPKF